MQNGIAGFIEGRYVDLSEHIQTDLHIELLKRTPSAYLGSCRFKLPEIEENKVPLDWITNNGTYVSPEFLSYARPLIQAELSPIMVDGLPSHLYN